MYSVTPLQPIILQLGTELGIEWHLQLIFKMREVSKWHGAAIETVCIGRRQSR